MFVSLFLAATALSPGQQAVSSYRDCLAPIVAANEKRSGANYLPLEKLVGRVEHECAVQRAAARDALATYVTAEVAKTDGRRPPEDDGWKEELIRDATLRWMNGVVAEGATN